MSVIGRQPQNQNLGRISPTNAQAEATRLGQELVTARITAARLVALIDAADTDSALRAFVPPDGADAALIDSQRRLLRSEAEEHRARLAQLAAELVRKRADRASVEATLKRLSDAIPLLAERVRARNTLAEQGWGSRLTYLEVQQQLVEMRQDRQIQQARITEADAAIAALETQRLALEAEFRRTRTAELAETERRAAGLAQELVKATQRQGWQTLTAPIDGVVQQLAVHTVGGVVTPAQPLMVIVPAADTIEIETRILNKDIGFVRPGQPAGVKLETFNFTRYGLVLGEVTTVSSDAIVDDKTGQVHYVGRVRLARTTITVDGKDLLLAAGMNASVEIKTDTRRVLEYLLSPILRYRQEALRER